MWCCVVRTCIHCCLNVSRPQVDVWEWLEVTSVAYMIPIWSSQCYFYLKDTQVFSKISNLFGHHTNLGNVTVWLRTCIHCCLGVSQPPSDVWEWLEVTLLTYLNSTWSLLYCYYQNDTQVFSKISKFCHHISLGNVTMWCKDIYPSFLEDLNCSIRYMWMIGSDFDSLYYPLFWQSQCCFYQKGTQVISKYPIFVTISAAWEMWCCVVRTDTHYCLSVF